MDSTARPGSSPLTRGKQLMSQHSRSSVGLIPAHAGKTRRVGFEGEGSRAHPRSRGENLRRAPGTHDHGGSSPLTRGKRTQGIVPGSSPGLIPAHAGKTDFHDPVLLGDRAHPRSRGENRSTSTRRRMQAGSSPLTRGKPVSRQVSSSSTGLIPAHAGKTDVPAVALIQGEAHPRSRGENHPGKEEHH